MPTQLAENSPQREGAPLPGRTDVLGNCNNCYLGVNGGCEGNRNGPKAPHMASHDPPGCPQGDYGPRLTLAPTPPGWDPYTQSMTQSPLWPQCVGATKGICNVQRCSVHEYRRGVLPTVTQIMDEIEQLSSHEFQNYTYTAGTMGSIDNADSQDSKE